MADEIIEELWRIKDELSAEAGKDLKAFCQRRNETAVG
jgi:formiminotetrahydrofolate cyclodeaminase